MLSAPKEAELEQPLKPKLGCGKAGSVPSGPPCSPRSRGAACSSVSRSVHPSYPSGCTRDPFILKRDMSFGKTLGEEHGRLRRLALTLIPT